MKKIKITILIIMLLCVKLVTGQCPSFEFEGVNSGHDFLNLSKYSNIEICESSGSIELGSKTFYILGKGYRNDYGQGDFIYDIQEARGYWPKIGFVKVAKDFSLIQLKFMNSVVTYNVSIKKEKGDDIILTGDYFAKDDENNKLSLKFSGNTVCTKHENDKLSYCYQFDQVKTNDLKSIGDFSYTGDLSFMKNVKGIFELTNQKLILTWGKNVANYIITGKDKSEEIAKNKIEEEKTKKIYEALNNGNYFKAKKMYRLLNNKNLELEEKINNYVLPIEKKMEDLYVNYKNSFKNKRAEYYKNPDQFILNEKDLLKIKKINTKEGKIGNIINPFIVNQTKDQLEDNMYFYTKQEGNHLICPLGLKANFHKYLYESKTIDQIIIKIKCDTSKNEYFGLIDFLNNDSIIKTGPIINSFETYLQTFTLEYPKELTKLIDELKNQECEYLANNFPELYFAIEYNEKITYTSASNINHPGKGVRNSNYENVRNLFNSTNLILPIFFSDENFKISFSDDNLFNPFILHLHKLIFPDADSIALELGSGYQGKFTDILPDQYERKLISIKIEGQENFARVIPLIKGKIEIKNNKLIVYDNSGNYKESQINIFKGSIQSIQNIDLKTLEYDSNFYCLFNPYNLPTDKIKNKSFYSSQNFIKFNTDKLKIWSKYDVNKVEFYNELTFNYIKNNNLFIQFLPINEALQLETTINYHPFFKEDWTDFSGNPYKLTMYRKFKNTSKYYTYMIQATKYKKIGDEMKYFKYFKKAQKRIASN